MNAQVISHFVSRIYSIYDILELFPDASRNPNLVMVVELVLGIEHCRDASNLLTSTNSLDAHLADNRSIRSA